MKELLHNFVESLREELKQYGELLALLDVQQDQVIRRLPEELLATVTGIGIQGEAIQAARREREQRQRELAQSLTDASDSRMVNLLPLLPEVYRPLVKALVDENNHLLSRVRARARQNHILLSHAVELMEKFINSFCSLSTPTYNHAGSKTAPIGTSRALYEEIC